MRRAVAAVGRTEGADRGALGLDAGLERRDDGRVQERFAAYGRGGEPCVVPPARRLRRTVIGQRGTSYCPALPAVLGRTLGREELLQLAARVERAQLLEPADRLRADHESRGTVYPPVRSMSRCRKCG